MYMYYYKCFSLGKSKSREGSYKIVTLRECKLNAEINTNRLKIYDHILLYNIDSTPKISTSMLNRYMIIDNISGDFLLLSSINEYYYYLSYNNNNCKLFKAIYNPMYNDIPIIFKNSIILTKKLIKKKSRHEWSGPRC